MVLECPGKFRATPADTVCWKSEIHEADVENKDGFTLGAQGMEVVAWIKTRVLRIKLCGNC